MQIRIKTSVEFILNEEEMYKENRVSIPIYIKQDKRNKGIPVFNMNKKYYSPTLLNDELNKNENNINQENIIL
jgi:hypothetical protein